MHNHTPCISIKSYLRKKNYFENANSSICSVWIDIRENCLAVLQLVFSLKQRGRRVITVLKVYVFNTKKEELVYWSESWLFKQWKMWFIAFLCTANHCLKLRFLSIDASWGRCTEWRIIVGINILNADQNLQL